MSYLFESNAAVEPVPGNVRIGVATTADQRESVFRFRYDVYIREMRQPLSAADHVRGLLTDIEDDGADILVATAAGGTIVGTLRLHLGTMPASIAARVRTELLPVSREKIALVGKTMVNRDQRGTKVFLALARTALSMALARGIRFGVLHCRPSLVPFYTRLGYRCHGVPFLDSEVGLQLPMVLDLAAMPDTLPGRHRLDRVA